jgi:hypothetical protein
MKRAYHYTTHIHYRLIQEQRIKSTAKLLDPGEKPVVWASLNPKWEERCSKCPYMTWYDLEAE